MSFPDSLPGDLTSILALGSELGVALPPAGLTGRRCRRAYGFENEAGLTRRDPPLGRDVSIWSGIQREIVVTRSNVRPA